MFEKIKKGLMMTGENEASRTLGQEAYKKNYLVDDYVLDNFIWNEKDQVWREEEPHV